MRGISWLAERVAAFASDRRGNFALIAAAVAPTLAMSVGFSVNVAQSYQLRSSLQNALDAAVTSTARDLTIGKTLPGDANASVVGFLAANTDAKFSKQDRFVLDSLTVDQTARTISATASADVAIAFPLFSMLAPHVRVDSAALYSDKSVEVAMMLDVTGSMKGGKISDLKTAASNAVDTLLSHQDATRPRVRVALVPYANSVNVGALAAKSVFVEKTLADRQKTGGNGDAKFVSSGGGRTDNCATERPGAQQYTDAGPDVSMVHRDYLLSTYAQKNPCPSVEIMPLTADAAALKKSIGNFAADGGTAGHIGVEWSWYMLSDKWGDVVPAAARPASPSKKVAKYAILMTDGEFNLSYFDVTDANNAYNGNGKTATRDAAKTLCKAMRNAGIEIFTVGFMLQEKNAKATLQDCASPDSASAKHYFEAATGKELDSAFREITTNIEALVLTR
jgi:Flp pilus assembly protein TadG